MINRFFFILLFSVFGCNYYRNIPNITSDKIKILYSNDHVHSVNSFLNKKKIDEIFFINSGHHIDPDRDGNVNEKDFEKYLKSIISSTRHQDYVVVDWESQFKYLDIKNASQKDYNNAVYQLGRCIEIGKRIMPNKKWGIYNLPFSSYWQRDADWKNNAKSLMPLLAKMDVIYPSLYDYYKDDNPFAGRIKDESYINETLDFIFEINKSLNKEIFVFIWHRWHDSNSEHPLKKIDEEEFANHVNKIVNFKKYNRHINGVVWWGADRYFYNVKHKSILEEKRPFNTFDDYFNSVFKTYMPIIIKEINKANI